MAGQVTTSEHKELDFTRVAVPESARMPAFALTMAWWSCCSAMFYIVVAATLATAYGTVNALIGIVLSVATYAVINWFVSRYAIRTGLSVSLFSRILFGTTGAALATLIFAATAIYYAVFEGSVIAVAINHLFPSVDYRIAALVVVLYSVPLVFGSVQNWLDRFNGVLLPLYLLGLALAVGLAIHGYGYSNAWLTAVPAAGASATGWWNVYTFYLGVAVLMMFCFDFARFGRPADSGYHGAINFGAPFYIVAYLVSGLVGIFLVHTIPLSAALSETAVVDALLALMGLLGLVFLWITQTRINTANYYLASVNLEALARLVAGLELPRYVWAVVVGIIVYVLMLADVFAYILQALAYQGIFVVAWVAVALAYMLMPQDTTTTTIAQHAHPAFNARGLIAWFAAVVVGIVLMNIPEAATFSAPCCGFVGFLLYRVMGARRPVTARA